MENLNKETIPSDGLTSVKTDIEKSVGMLTVAVEGGRMTQDGLKAEVKWLEEANRILDGAVPSANSAGNKAWRKQERRLGP